MYRFLRVIYCFFIPYTTLTVVSYSLLGDYWGFQVGMSLGMLFWPYLFMHKRFHRNGFKSVWMSCAVIFGCRAGAILAAMDPDGMLLIFWYLIYLLLKGMEKQRCDAEEEPYHACISLEEASYEIIS